MMWRLDIRGLEHGDQAKALIGRKIVGVFTEPHALMLLLDDGNRLDIESATLTEHEFPSTTEEA